MQTMHKNRHTRKYINNIFSLLKQYETMDETLTL